MPASIMDGEAGPTISAVIPTYNRAARIGRALASVFEQERPADEVVVIDDGSTDGTASVLREFGTRIRVVTQRNRGVSRARNRGVEEAAGQWIAFLDSDDTWAPEYLRRIDEAIHATGAAAAVYFADALFEEDGGEQSAWDLAGFTGEPPQMMITEAAAVFLGEMQPALLPFSVLRRSAVKNAGGFWERLSTTEDTHLLIKLSLRHPFCAVVLKGGVVRGIRGASDRLTGRVAADSIEHWVNAVLLWEDLLRTTPASVRSRSTIRIRLADAYWRLARINMRERNTPAAAVNLMRSVLTDPRSLGRAFTRRVGVREFHRGTSSKT